APAGTPSACGAARDARSARNRPAPGARLASSGNATGRLEENGGRAAPGIGRPALRDRRTPAAPGGPAGPLHRRAHRGSRPGHRRRPGAAARGTGPARPHTGGDLPGGARGPAPSRASDDIALLVARTRVLAPGQTADWDVPREAEAVRRVRLLRDRTLICEVSDGSSTAPHRRRVATTDEGGRGLFLVARYAERRGTRYTATGKVIWAEQPLHGADVQPFGTAAESVLDQWSDAEW
ncbi:hypothetical protein GT031_17380, partial [Streptomyces sp. SID2888]|nr:hypothetical protein [Streptomyces sp. SID2888]